MARTRIAFAALLAGLALLGAVPRTGYADGQVTYGTQWLDLTAPEAKYQEFTEVPNGLFLQSFEIREMRKRNLLTFYGSGLLQNDEAIAGSWWNGAKLRVDVGYRQVPHNLSLIARSPFSEIAPGVLVVSDSLQARNQANSAGYVARMTDELNASPRLGLGFRTDITKARVRGRPAKGWQFDLTGSRRLRSGRKPFGGAFSPGNGVELWEPIAQRILDGEARASYEKNRATFMAAAGVSQFTNNVDALTWDNPAKLTGSQNKGRIDLYPDNRSVRGTLAGAYRLPRRTAVNATVALSRDTQDDPWLPFTVIATDPYSAVDSLPKERNTQAKVDVVTQDYRVTSHPLSDLGGTLRFHQYHYVNHTPVHDFAGESVADGNFALGAVENEPFNYRNTSYGLDLDYTPLKEATLSGTAERTDRHRSHREVLSDREETVVGKLRLRPMDNVTAEGHVRRSKRWARESDFSYDGVEQTALRRFDVADRKQMQAGGSVSFALTDQFELAATFGYLFEKFAADSADTVRIGLRRNHQRNAGVEGTFHVSPTLDLSASLGWEQTVARQSSRQSRTASFGTADSTWRARLKDEGVYGNAGIDWRAKPDLGFNLGFEYSRTPGTFQFATASPTTITAQSPPATIYKRLDFAFETTYRLMKNTEIGARYVWEEFDVQDFAAVDIPLLGVATGASSANFIYLGDSFQSYRAHRAALMVHQRF
jgi:MtrB/PioB family decaheme-associated outer membrane protein